nr:MAG TPA: Photosystem II reaction centre I protein (PSII 4.8 kDa protein) [Caudoviricetes sp.]
MILKILTLVVFSFIFLFIFDWIISDSFRNFIFTLLGVIVIIVLCILELFGVIAF